MRGPYGPQGEGEERTGGVSELCKCNSAFAGMTEKGETSGRLPPPDPGELVLVVVEMQQTRARDRGEALCRRMIRLALEFERADEVAHQTRHQPALDQRQQPRGIADDIAEEPVDGPDLGGVEGE